MKSITHSLQKCAIFGFCRILTMDKIQTHNKPDSTGYSFATEP